VNSPLLEGLVAEQGLSSMKVAHLLYSQYITPAPWSPVPVIRDPNFKDNALRALRVDSAAMERGRLRLDPIDCFELKIGAFVVP
jgi:hypothetical protein